MQEKDLYCPYISVVAAVSQDKGLEYLETHMGAINSELFVDFVKRIVNLRKKSKVALFICLTAGKVTPEWANRAGFQSHGHRTTQK